MKKKSYNSTNKCKKLIMFSSIGFILAYQMYLAILLQ